jgi:epoxide hydrolase-like predicted phosphatase
MPAPESGLAAARGLLTDYGGVMTNPLGPAMAAFCRSRGLPDDALAELARPESSFRAELDAYERGEYDDSVFLPRFAQALGLPGEAMDGFLDDVRPDDRMFAAVAALRSHGVRVGLLSNSWGMSGYPRELLTDAFDGVVISAEVGMRKPEPQIYRHAAEVIGVAPSSCVFVDDSRDQLEAATQVGMTAIHHVDQVRTLRELERLFGVELGDEAT